MSLEGNANSVPFFRYYFLIERLEFGSLVLYYCMMTVLLDKDNQKIYVKMKVGGEGYKP